MIVKKVPFFFEYEDKIRTIFPCFMSELVNIYKHNISLCHSTDNFITELSYFTGLFQKMELPLFKCVSHILSLIVFYLQGCKKRTERRITVS